MKFYALLGVLLGVGLYGCADDAGTRSQDSEAGQTMSSAGWQFSDPRNLAVISLRRIFYEGRPILFVSHDADDNSWQFLDGGEVATDDAIMVGLHEVVAHDPSIEELAELPIGWVAVRESVDQPWQRYEREE